MKKMILLAAMLLVGVLTAGAQTTTTSEKSTILQTIEIPAGTIIHDGVTRTGNPKCWIELNTGDKVINVSVSPSNATKFRNGEIKLEIVKRQNNETGRITYSTRQLGGGRRTTSGNPNIDLTTVKIQ